MSKHAVWQWVIGAVLLVGAVAGLAIADARSDLDARKREYDNVKREYQTLYREVDGYLGNSRALRSFDKDELERLIKAMCGEDVARDGDEASYVVQICEINPSRRFEPSGTTSRESGIRWRTGSSDS